MNLAGIVEYVTTLSGYLLATLGGIGISLGGLGLFALTHPDKLEKWFSILLKLLSELPGIFRSAHKQYVKHDLQGRVNSFARGLAKQAPYLEARRLSPEWVDGEITKRSFLQDDRVVIRLKRDDPHDLNFTSRRICIRFDQPGGPGEAVHLGVAAGRSRRVRNDEAD